MALTDAWLRARQRPLKRYIANPMVAVSASRLLSAIEAMAAVLSEWWQAKNIGARQLPTIGLAKAREERGEANAAEGYRSDGGAQGKAAAAESSFESVARSGMNGRQRAVAAPRRGRSWIA
jgi:hypothetical protein